MRLGRAWIIAATAACLWVSAPALAQTPTSSSDDERARTHFTAGRSYFEEGNYEQALSEFQHAYELSHRAPLLVNVANCQERLGQWREAAATLEQYLGTPDANDEDRGTMTRRIEALRQRADQRDAEEAARLQAAHGDGSGSATTTTTTSTPTTGEPASDGLLLPAIIAFGVGGAAAIAWGVLGGLALSDQSAIQAGCGATRSCTPAQVSEMNSFAVGADVSMTIALVGVAAGAVMLIVSPPHGASAGGAEHARVLPWGGSQGGGLVLSGSF
jgi:hypothetical protein